MADLPPAVTNRRTHYECAELGGHGEDFQRRIALLLVQRAVLNKEQFRLAFEMKAAGKFDDVGLYLDQRDEWWLIQAKHAEYAGDLSYEALFPKDEKGKKMGNFTIFKYLESYVFVKDYWPHGGCKIKFFLFTNKGLDKKVPSEPVNRIDKLLVFSKEGEHLKLKPSECSVKELLNYVNSEFGKLVEAIIDLFKNAVMSDILNNYKNPLSEILMCTNGKVYFSSKFKDDHSNPRVRQLHKRLQMEFEEDISKISVSKTKEMSKFFIGRSRIDELPPQADIETVQEFFDHLTLSVNQPNADELLKVINKEWIRWMKSWIRPDDFGRLNLSQLEQPFNAFKRGFKDWEKEGANNEKTFLDLERGAKLLNQVQEELSDVIEKSSKQSCVSLREIQRYYINRRISSQNECLMDAHFIEHLPEDENCFLLVAEPGMGKSTLWQYLAFHAQQNISNSHIFLLYLNNLKEPLSKVEELSHVPDVLKTELSLQNLNLFEQRDKNIILFLDAFDELKRFNDETILNLVQVLKKRGKAKILISSRRCVQKMLQKELKISAMILESFNLDDQIMFLRKFWYVTEANEERFKQFSSKLLSKFHSDIHRREYDFTGMPLMIKMLADIYTDEFKVFIERGLSSIESGDKFTVIELYEKFIAKCITITINKKMNTNNKDEVDSFFDPLFEAWEKFYQLFAIKMFFPETLLSQITDENFKGKIEQFNAKIVQKQEESLLIEAVGGNPQFTHLSYGEFFAAKYLYEYVGRTSNTACDEQIVKVLHDNEAIRHFFLAMINREAKENHRKFIQYRSSSNWIVRWCSQGDFVNLLEYLNEFYVYTSPMYDSDLNRPLLLMAARHNACQTLQYLLKSGAGHIDMLGCNSDTAFHNACECGHFEAVELLINAGANIKQTNIKGNTGLHLAAISDNVDLVQYLLKLTPSQLDMTNKRKKTALHVAIEEKAKKVARFLVSCGAKLDLLDNMSASPLMLAVEHYQKDMADFLIEHAAKIDYPDRSIFEGAAENGFPKIVQLWLDRNLLVTQRDLSLAIKNGNLQIVKMLVVHGVSPHMTIAGNSSMHYAAQSGNREVVQYLIEQSVEIDTRNLDGKTPLLLVAERGNGDDIASVLISKNANIAAVDSANESVLFKAAKSGDKALVKILLDLSVELNVQSKSGSTALHEAIKSNQKGIVRLLLQEGADVNLQGETGNTALHEAVLSGSMKISRLVLERSDNIDALNANGRTPLQLALEKKNRYISKLLIDNNANVTHTDEKGRTILLTTILHCYRDLVEILIDHALSEINTPDENGFTLLHHALSNPYSDVVALLIEKGADPNARNHRGCTPLHEVANVGETDHAKILLEMGADVMARNDIGQTALQIAQSREDRHMEELLRAYGAYLTEEDEISKNTTCIALR